MYIYVYTHLLFKILVGAHCDKDYRQIRVRWQPFGNGLERSLERRDSRFGKAGPKLFGRGGYLFHRKDGRWIRTGYPSNLPGKTAQSSYELLRMKGPAAIGDCSASGKALVRLAKEASTCRSHLSGWPLRWLEYSFIREHSPSFTGRVMYARI